MSDFLPELMDEFQPECVRCLRPTTGLRLGPSDKPVCSACARDHLDRMLADPDSRLNNLGGSQCR